ncbi:MAG: hypothetical protein HZA00_13080 [Nitrospinae bacterium]|nr:hypothetical protein [Nitrospinota bacterium]
MKRLLFFIGMICVVLAPAISLSEVARQGAVLLMPNLKYDVPPKAKESLGIKVAMVTPNVSITPWTYQLSETKSSTSSCFLTGGATGASASYETGTNKIRYEKEKMGEAYIKSVQQDAGKIIMAKGFEIDGPYATIDEIDITKKEKVDVIFTSDISLVTDSTEVRHKMEAAGGCFSGGENATTYYGPFPIQMAVNLNFYAPGGVGENTLLLNKKFSMDTKREILFKVGQKRKSSSSVGVIDKTQSSDWSDVERDDVSPQIVSAMEELYPKTMKKIWDYINPEEMRIIKKKADELKKKIRD